MKKTWKVIVILTLLLLFSAFNEVPKYQITQKIEYNDKIVFLNVSMQKDNLILFQARTMGKNMKAIQTEVSIREDEVHIKPKDIKTMHEIFGIRMPETIPNNQYVILRKGWIYELASSYVDMLLVHSSFVSTNLSKELIATSVEESGTYPFKEVLKVLNVPEDALKNLIIDKRLERDEVVSAFRLSNENIKLYFNFIIK